MKNNGCTCIYTPNLNNTTSTKTVPAIPTTRVENFNVLYYMNRVSYDTDGRYDKKGRKDNRAKNPF